MNTSPKEERGGTILGISQCGGGDVCVKCQGQGWGTAIWVHLGRERPPRMTLVCTEGYPARIERIEVGWHPPGCHLSPGWGGRGGKALYIQREREGRRGALWGHPGPTLPLQSRGGGSRTTTRRCLVSFPPRLALIQGRASGQGEQGQRERIGSQPPSPKSPGAKCSPPVSGALRPPSQVPSTPCLRSSGLLAPAGRSGPPAAVPGPSLGERR